MLYFKKWQTEILLGIFFLFVLLHMILGHVTSRSAETAGKDACTYSIFQREEKDRRGSANDYDATADYVFFSYSSRQSVVDVYDRKGVYAFSFRFSDQQNGVLSLQCQDDLLYVGLKNNSVMVFDRDCLIAVYGGQEAKEMGFDYFWFEEPSKSIVLDGLTFYALDDTGERQQQIPVPGHIAHSFYEFHRTVVFVVLGAGLVLLNTFLDSRRQHKSRNTPPPDSLPKR